MLEKSIEKKLADAVKKRGGLAPKFVSPGLDGMPDRIVLMPGGRLAFVEVKLRRDASHGEAREFVTARKQERLRAAAELWLSQHETPLQPRFDVVEVYAPRGEDGPVQIRHIENAFM